jgi:hypothetical protein
VAWADPLDIGPNNVVFPVEGGSHYSQELLRVEGLGDVMYRPVPEAADLFFDGVPGGEKKKGHGTVVVLCITDIKKKAFLTGSLGFKG